MNEQQCAHLETLFDHGFYILIENGYLDSFITALYEKDGEGYVYSSTVMDESPLSEVDVTQVKVFLPASYYWKHNENSLPDEDLHESLNARMSPDLEEAIKEFLDEDSMA